MWHILSHFAHTNGRVFAAFMVFFLTVLFMVMAHTKRGWPYAAFFAVASLFWHVMDGASPFSLLETFFVFLSYTSLTLFINLLKSTNKPSA